MNASGSQVINHVTLSTLVWPKIYYPVFFIYLYTATMSCAFCFMSAVVSDMYSFLNWPPYFVSLATPGSHAHLSLT